mmetsp:Transcript_34398/g.97443  ORF Transcript_34398/g.97443 Transcript_34398/m.97443 type:complete len:204 (+) Transcript_34398:260-871(+)
MPCTPPLTTLWLVWELLQDLIYQDLHGSLRLPPGPLVDALPLVRCKCKLRVQRDGPQEGHPHGLAHRLCPATSRRQHLHRGQQLLRHPRQRGLKRCQHLGSHVLRLPCSPILRLCQELHILGRHSQLAHVLYHSQDRQPDLGNKTHRCQTSQQRATPCQTTVAPSNSSRMQRERQPHTTVLRRRGGGSLHLLAEVDLLAHIDD